ncbi:MAG: hypothetical protein WDZ40_00675 [Candidatus Spechtbacterales bacterium]
MSTSDAVVSYPKTEEDILARIEKRRKAGYYENPVQGREAEMCNEHSLPILFWGTAHCAQCLLH